MSEPVKGISLLWTKGMTTEEAIELTKRVVEQEDLFIKLEKIIEEKISESVTAQISNRGFDNAAWAYHQAYLNGQLNALTAIKTVIKLRD